MQKNYNHDQHQKPAEDYQNKGSGRGQYRKYDYNSGGGGYVEYRGPGYRGGGRGGRYHNNYGPKRDYYHEGEYRPYRGGRGRGGRGDFRGKGDYRGGRGRGGYHQNYHYYQQDKKHMTNEKPNVKEQDDFDWGQDKQKEQQNQKEQKSDLANQQIQNKQGVAQVSAKQQSKDQIGLIDQLMQQLTTKTKKKQPRLLEGQKQDPLCWDDDWNDQQKQQEAKPSKKKKKGPVDSQLRIKQKIFSNANRKTVSLAATNQYQIQSKIKIELNDKQSLSNNARQRARKGMTNTRNNCFMNAILQCLYACPPFFNLLSYLRDKNNNDQMGKENVSLISSFQQLFNYFDISLNSKGTQAQRAAKVVKVQRIFCNILNEFNPYNEQCDAQEFCGLLLDLLNNQLVYLKQNNNQDSDATKQEEQDDQWQQIGKDGVSRTIQKTSVQANQQSPIADIFGGVFKNQFTVKGSKHKTVTHQSFFTLSLDIEGAYTLNDVFTDFFSPGTVDDYVQYGSQKATSATHTILLDKLPPILIVHFKRFRFNKVTKSICKECSIVDLEDIMEIPQSSLSASCEDKVARYQLFGVVDHKGKQVGKGHYTAFIKQSKSKWIYYDDQKVSALQDGHKFKCRVMAYLMFYRKL